MALERAPSAPYSDHFARFALRAGEAALRRLEAAPQPDGALLEQAMRAVDYVIALEEGEPLAARLFHALAPPMERGGFRDAWRLLLEGSVANAGSACPLAIWLHFWLGNAYRHRSEFESAIASYERSRSTARAVSDPLGEARALNRLAFIAYLQERPEARTLAQEAATLACGEPAESGYSLLVRGLLAHSQRDYAQACQLHEQALVNVRRTGDERLVAWALANLGASLTRLKRVEQAAASYHEAIDLFERLQDRASLAVARMELGNLFLSQGEPAEALRLYRIAEEEFRRTHEWDALARLANNIGLAYHRLGAPEAAARYLNGAIERHRGLGNLPSVVNATDSLALVLLDLERAHEAVTLLEEAIGLLESLVEGARREYLREMVGRTISLACARRAALTARAAWTTD